MKKNKQYKKTKQRKEEISISNYLPSIVGSIDSILGKEEEGINSSSELIFGGTNKHNQQQISPTKSIPLHAPISPVPS
jgi:DNA topoisomerase VI subunit B